MPWCISSSLLSICSPSIHCPAKDLLLPVILGPDSVSDQATLLWTQSRFFAFFPSCHSFVHCLLKLNEEGQQEEISLKRRGQRKPANIISTIRLGNRVSRSTKEKSGSHKAPLQCFRSLIPAAFLLEAFWTLPYCLTPRALGITSSLMNSSCRFSQAWANMRVHFWSLTFPFSSIIFDMGHNSLTN